MWGSAQIMYLLRRFSGLYVLALALLPIMLGVLVTRAVETVPQVRALTAACLAVLYYPLWALMQEGSRRMTRRKSRPRLSEQEDLSRRHLSLMNN